MHFMGCRTKQYASACRVVAGLDITGVFDRVEKLIREETGKVRILQWLWFVQCIGL
jgi:hypothetical protein